jgi:hypothetical protein
MKTNLIGISGKIGSGKDTVGKIFKYLDFEKNVMGGRTSYGLGNFSIESSNYQIKKFADKLKDIACLLIGCTREHLEDREFKEKELGEKWWRYKIHDGSVFRWATLEEYNKEGKYQKFIVKLTPRKLLQLLGTECGRQILHPNIWVNALFADYKGIDNPLEKGYLEEWGKPNWIITDVRFPNEAKAIKDRGGIVIRVNRLTELRFPKLWSGFQSQDEIDSWDDYLRSIGKFNKVYHFSETALDGYEFDNVIENNGSIEELVEKVKQLKLV